MKQEIFESFVDSIERNRPTPILGHCLTKEQYEIVEGIIEKKIAVWQDLLTMYSTKVVDNE